jgi:FMN-dependent NADH-azoreductase
MRLLYINACVRKDSRTDRIARKLVGDLIGSGTAEEIRLDSAGLLPLNEERLQERTELIGKRAWDSPVFRYARQFADADVIVIAAPYWDGSFPAVLKLYLENIYVTGIVSHYSDDGRPCGMCRAGKLYYVTTAGGPYRPDYSYDYLRDLAVNCFGIPETELIKAEMLDVQGYDAKAIVDRTIKELRR